MLVDLEFRGQRQQLGQLALELRAQMARGDLQGAVPPGHNAPVQRLQVNEFDLNLFLIACDGQLQRGPGAAECQVARFVVEVPEAPAGAAHPDVLYLYLAEHHGGVVDQLEDSLQLSGVDPGLIGGRFGGAVGLAGDAYLVDGQDELAVQDEIEVADLDGTEGQVIQGDAAPEHEPQEQGGGAQHRNHRQPPPAPPAPGFACIHDSPPSGARCGAAPGRRLTGGPCRASLMRRHPALTGFSASWPAQRACVPMVNHKRFAVCLRPRRRCRQRAVRHRPRRVSSIEPGILSSCCRSL